jgi:uncharacterized NAD(P)/FAD-binding protein YdhS
MTRRRVAIIGAGFSGTVVAAHLLARGRHAPEVALIERRPRFGRGLAYGANDAAHLLNVRAANMSAFADRPDHFVRWLAARAGGKQPARFAPRAQYGAYIEDVLRRARAGWFGPGAERVHGEAVACHPVGEGWAISLASGRRVEADAVVLALGNPPPAPQRAFEEGGVPVAEPWDTAALARLPAGDVLLLGTGLTMIDMALSLTKRRRRGIVYALSRRGQAPRAHLQSAAPPAPAVQDYPVPLSEALHALRRETAAMAERGEPWQHAIDRLRARTPELWRRLPLDAQLRFLRHLRPWWDAHRHRAAPEIAARVAELAAAGRLRILAGEIVSAQQAGRRIEVQHRQRGSHARHRLEVVGVVNCTGAALDPWLSKDALVRQLLDDGIARAHACGLGFDVDADGGVLAASGAAQPNLYAIGPITQGAFWEATAVPEIRVRAAALALMLTQQR